MEDERPLTGTDHTGIRCLLQSCTGTYRKREILHCVERVGETDGSPAEAVCIDHVPALVCDVCGDVQFEATTARRLQALLESRDAPDKHLPIYDFNRQAPTV